MQYLPVPYLVLDVRQVIPWLTEKKYTLNYSCYAHSLNTVWAIPIHDCDHFWERTTLNEANVHQVRADYLHQWNPQEGDLFAHTYLRFGHTEAGSNFTI